MIQRNKNYNIIIFVYDITNKSSFKSLDERISEMKNIYYKYKFQGVIIGNKKELKNKEEVTETEGIELAKKYNYKFYLASAKDDPNGFINFLEELIKNFISNEYKNILT